MPSVGARLRISGHVQGVGFRFYCYQKAVALGLTGWVRNETDGTVVAKVEGERGMIDELVAVLRIGPPSSSVSDVEIDWRPFEGRFESFEITRVY